MKRHSLTITGMIKTYGYQEKRRLRFFRDETDRLLSIARPAGGSLLPEGN